MSQLINLIRNELIKIFTRIHTLVMIGILLLSVILLVANTGRLGVQLNQSIWGLVSNQVSSLFWINIFEIIIAGGIIANEFNWGTIKLLLIRPANRGKILLSKYLAVALFGLILLLLLFLTALIFNGLLYGIKNGISSGNTTSDGMTFGKPSMREIFFNTFPGVVTLYLIKYIEVLMYGTFAFMLSVISKSNAFTIGSSFFTMVFGPEITRLFSDKLWVKYIIFPNLDLTQYIGVKTGIYPGMNLFFSIAIILGYWAVLNIISWLFFTKRDVLN